LLEPGDQIDIWVIEKRLGSGGMGSVYRCRNQAARRILAAIKVLDGAVARNADARARFVREAEILFTLEHENIVKVRNVRVDGDLPYIEMEFVEGESLEDRLSRMGGLPVGQAVSVITQLTQAITYLHERGVRHRDIKPANLLIDKKGTARLVDFGLALEADSNRLTQGHMSFGTVSYAPPEWIDPEKLDPVQWDLYAIGVVFWETLTGAVAFPVAEGGDVRQQAFQVILKKQEHPPLDPGPNFPVPIRQLIRDLTQSKPQDRIQSASELLQRLLTLDGVTPSQVAPPPPPNTPTPAPANSARTGHADTFSLDDGSNRPAPPRFNLDETAEMSPRRAKKRRGLRMAAMFLAGFTLTAVAALTVAGVWALLNLGPRAVELIADGLADGDRFDARIDGAPPTQRVLGKLGFAAKMPGEYTLDWVAGPGCAIDQCVGTRCPDGCVSDRIAVEIPRGMGTYSHTIVVPRPPARQVVLKLPTLPSALPANISLHNDAGELPGRLEGHRWVGDGVPPGRYRAVVVLGECPESAIDCADDCPPGCRHKTLEVPVPAGSAEIPHETTLMVLAPTAPPKTAPSTPTTTPKATTKPPDSVAPTPAARTPQRVTVAQYSAWLDKNPDWQPENVRATPRADEQYLKGWDTRKPSGASAVKEVSGFAARAYCAQRGGLLSHNAAPTSWSDDVAFEWRRKGDRTVLIDENGTETPSKERDSNAWTSFRCAK
jgi:serine/threonine protein kinase